MGDIYCWFEFLFGQYLAEYLWGYDCATQVYDGRNLFDIIGFITLMVSFLCVLAYYYLPLKFFNHPRSNRWWNWLIMLIIVGLINFSIAYLWTRNDFLNGNIGYCLMYQRDASGNIISYLIHRIDFFLFGLSNFFISTLFFLIGTLLFKWWSRNCKHSPCF